MYLYGKFGLMENHSEATALKLFWSALSEAEAVPLCAQIRQPLSNTIHMLLVGAFGWRLCIGLILCMCTPHANSADEEKRDIANETE